MSTCKAAVAHGANQPFTVEDVVVAAPRAGEVLVRIAGVGLCHTDLVFRDQFDAFAKPAVLGHEGSGVIEAVGEGVSGLAPGRLALTEIVGKSTCGSGATGNWKKLITPAMAMPSVSSVVAMGRWMKGAETFMPQRPWHAVPSISGSTPQKRGKSPAW